MSAGPGVVNEQTDFVFDPVHDFHGFPGRLQVALAGVELPGGPV
jgi:hypothetical protein